jgi:hypothetical protein
MGADDMKSVSYVGTEGGFISMSTTEEVVTEGVERGATWAMVIGEFGRKAWKAKLAL